MTYSTRLPIGALFAGTGILALVAYRADIAAAFWICILAFPAMILTLLGSFSRLATIFLSITGVAIALLVMFGEVKPGQFDAALFIFGFILTSGLLREIARQDQALQKVGALLVTIKSSLRYPLISLSVAVQSITLLLGALHMFSGVVSSQKDWDSTTRAETLTAGLIGFALNPILSPLAIPFIVISSILPDLSWSALAPSMASMVACVWLAGLIQNKFLYQRRAAQRELTAPSDKPSLEISALLLIISPVLLTLLVKGITGARLGDSALIGIAITAFIWSMRLGGPTRFLVTGLTSARNEAVVIGGSIASGTALLSFIPVELLQAPVSYLAHYVGFLPMIILISFVLLGQIGLQPSICFLILLPALELLLGYETISPAPLIAATITGWVLNSITSPVGVPALIASQAGDVVSTVFVWRWNSLFTLVAVALCSLVLALQI